MPMHRIEIDQLKPGMKFSKSLFDNLCSATHYRAGVSGDLGSCGSQKQVAVGGQCDPSDWPIAAAADLGQR